MKTPGVNLSDLLPSTMRNVTGSPVRFFFELPAWLRSQLRGLDTPANRLGFVLQWGYFQASGRFFKPLTFALGDILFVARQLKVDPLSINLRHYRRNTLNRHRQMIRQALGFTSYAGPGKAMVEQEAAQLAARQTHPERLFWALCGFMRSHRIEPGRRSGAHLLRLMRTHRRSHPPL